MWMKRSEMSGINNTIFDLPKADLPKALIVVDDLQQNCKIKPENFRFVPSSPTNDLL